MRIEIATDTISADEFCNWLNSQGHDATVGSSTGSYIDGEWTSTDDSAARIYRELWDAFSAELAMYMNTETGQVDNYEGWYYENEDGEEVNAVDLNEVVEVIMVNGEWVEA